MNDLTISNNNFSVEGNCSRWDTDNYQIIIEIWLKKSQIKEIKDNTTPGAVAELYNILGKPFYYDKTWDASNTLILTPNPNSTSNLKKARNEMVIFPKTITDIPIKGDSEFLNLKIEGYISGNLNL